MSHFPGEGFEAGIGCGGGDCVEAPKIVLTPFGEGLFVAGSLVDEAQAAFHGSRFLTGREAAEGEAEEGPSGEGGGHYLIDYLIEFAIT